MANANYKSINLFRHRKALARLARITWHYRLMRRSVVDYPPYRLWIEPTNRCNLKCVMCPNKEFAKEDLGFMDWALYTRLVDEARGYVHDINLHHRGESTLHPRLVEMIQYADAKGVKVKLHTNGSTLTEKMSRDLVKSGLRLISFSFDGYTHDLYEKVRVGAKFEKTLNNIHRFLDLQRESGSAYPRTVMEVMELESDTWSIAEKQTFIQNLKRRGLDRLIVKRPHNWAGNVSLDTYEKQTFSPCTFPWHGLVVLWDGRVGSCPHDFFAEIIYGDAKESSLFDIFNSEKIQKVREQMLSGCMNRLNSPCRECDSVRRRRMLGIPLSSLKYLRD